MKSKLKDKKFEELTDEEIWSLIEEEAQINFEGMLKKIREFSSERVREKWGHILSKKE